MLYNSVELNQKAIAALHNRSMFFSQRSCNVRAVGLPIPVKTAENKVNIGDICCACRRQFIDVYEPKGYPDEIKRECLEMLYHF